MALKESEKTSKEIYLLAVVTLRVTSFATAYKMPQLIMRSFIS